MVFGGFGPRGVSGVEEKLTFSKITDFEFLVICLSVGLLMKPSKGDFGAPKKWALECQNGFPKLPEQAKTWELLRKVDQYRNQ